MDFSISRAELESELREEADTLRRAIRWAPEWSDCPTIEAYYRRELEAVRAFLAHLEAETVNVSAAPEKPAQAAKAPRCKWYRDIRRCFAIAAAAGLDTKADAAMRDALGSFLGRRVGSREELNGAEWGWAGDAVKAGNLTW